MAISAGDAGCTTGLSGAIYAIWLADTAAGLGASTAAIAAAKAMCFDWATAIANVGNAGWGGGGSPSVQDEGVNQGAAGTLNFVGAGVTATVAGGVATITIAGGGGSVVFVDNEIPSGTINGSNTAFTLANAPTAGSVHLYLNGVRLRPTTDYSITGTAITMVMVPQTGDWLYADYRR
jgi:hypothetical protein